MRLSPDGTHFSAIEPVNGHPTVLVFQIHPLAGARPQVYALKDADADGSMWVNSDRLICYFYQNKYHDESTGVNLRTFARAVSVSISGKAQPFFLMEGSRVYSQNGGQGIGVVGLNVDKPELIYTQSFRYYGAGDGDTRLGNGRARLELFAVNAETNSIDMIESGERFAVGFRMDEHGNVVGRVDRTDASELPANTDTFFVRDGDWRQVGTYDNSHGRFAHLLNPGADGNGLVVLKYGSHDKQYLETQPIKGGGSPHCSIRTRTTTPTGSSMTSGPVAWWGRVTPTTRSRRFSSIRSSPTSRSAWRRRCRDRRWCSRPGTRSAIPSW